MKRLYYTVKVGASSKFIIVYDVRDNVPIAILSFDISLDVNSEEEILSRLIGSYIVKLILL